LKQLSQRAPAPQQQKQKGLGQDERRVCRKVNDEAVAIMEEKNVKKARE